MTNQCFNTLWERCEDIETFDTLDGLEVVPYQCIVRRSDWERVRSLSHLVLTSEWSLDSEIFNSTVNHAWFGVQLTTLSRCHSNKVRQQFCCHLRNAFLWHLPLGESCVSQGKWGHVCAKCPWGGWNKVQSAGGTRHLWEYHCFSYANRYNVKSIGNDVGCWLQNLKKTIL